jgi:hypothetical protein
VEVQPRIAQGSERPVSDGDEFFAHVASERKDGAPAAKRKAAVPPWRFFRFVLVILTFACEDSMVAGIVLRREDVVDKSFHIAAGPDRIRD